MYIDQFNFKKKYTQITKDIKTEKNKCNLLINNIKKNFNSIYINNIKLKNELNLNYNEINLPNSH